MLRKIWCLTLVFASCIFGYAQETESTYYTFCQGCNSVCLQEGSCPADGEYPGGNLVQGPDGSFYGTTQQGGMYGYGTVFKVTPVNGEPYGDEVILYNFTGGSDGEEPTSGVILAGDGNFYGTTAGTFPDESNPPYQCVNLSGCGTIFQVTPSGAFTTIYSFCVQSGCPDGFEPQALTLGGDGNLYGATENYLNGIPNVVNIFKVTLSGNYSSVATFNGELEGASLLQATDGNFYVPGFLYPYSSGENASILRITPAGAVSAFYTFPAGRNLPSPSGPLIEGSDGSLYGATAEVGGSGSPSEIFKVNSAAVLTTLATYCTSCAAEGDTNSLLFGSDGNIYGTAQSGGTVNGACEEGCGTVFQMTPAGSTTTLYSFKGGSDSEDPFSGLIETSSGSFYGIASGDGVMSGSNSLYGTLYKIALSTPPAAPVSVSLNQSSLTLGNAVTVNWTVKNAFSETMQQCYGFSTLDGVTTPLGKATGTLSNGIYSGSATFTPTADGTYSLALTCGGVESGFATLTVTGSSEPITFTSVTHNFGSLQVGTSSSYGVKVTNPNAFAFPFHLTLTGPSTFTEATNCGSSIPGNGSCQIEFYFAPTSATTQTATWSLTANSATFSPSNGGTLTGTGVLNGSLNYTTSVHNFGTYTVGTDSPVYGTVLTNSYNFPVTLGYTTSGSTTSFSLLTNCGATLAAGQSCNADFTFTPKATGFVTETVGVTASYKGSPIAVTSLGQTITGITLKGTGQ